MSTEVKAYKCDFCSRIMKSKGAMTRHEKFCTKNPSNDFKCFYCKHLVYWRSSGADNEDGYRKHFSCEKLKIGLHTHRAVQRNLVEVLATTELMRLECYDLSIGCHKSREVIEL